MIIDELVLHNFGVYKGRQSLDLTPQPPDRPIILIGGLNGGGKTTILDALQLAFFGKRAQCSNRGRLGYDEYLRRCIHRGCNPKEGTAVEVAFRQVIDGEEQRIRVHRSWAPNGNGVRERVEVIRDGQKDPVLTEAWDDRVEAFLPSRLAHLFFFDGEKIETLADLDQSRELLRSAIGSLLGLDLVDQLETDLTVLLRRKRREAVTQPEHDQPIQELEDQVRTCERRLRLLHHQEAELNNQKERADALLHELDEQLRAQGGELFQQRKAIERDRERLVEAVEAQRAELRELAAGPAPLVLVMDQLRDVLGQAEREQQATEALLLQELLGRRDKKVVTLLRVHASDEALAEEVERALADDRKERANATAIDVFLGLSKEETSRIEVLVRAELPLEQARIGTALERLARLESELDTCDRRLAAVPDEDAVSRLLTEREQVRASLERLSVRAHVIQGEIADAERVLQGAKSRLASTIEKVAEATMRSEDIERTIRHAEKARATLGEFKTQVTRHHVERIQGLIFDSFRQLLRKRSLVDTLHIEPASMEIEFYDRDRHRVKPDRLSAGERQLLAVSILWGLARASGRVLPAIIDTPLGRLDSSHRRHLVQRYFPNASHQVVLLSTDEEINAGHYRKLKHHVARSYLLDFDDRLRATTIQKEYFPETASV